MYDILLKWGLESLQKVSLDKGKEELAVTLEAIKIRNQFVFSRYQYAFSSCEAMNDLIDKMDEELSQNNSKEHGHGEGYLDYLEHKFHPTYYRKFQKLRTKFEMTNDLLAGYSLTTASLVRFNKIKSLCKKNKCVSQSDINDLYRHLWHHYSGLMNVLVRVASNDMRFWLTDSPYVVEAQKMAKIELKLFEKFFTSGVRSSYLTLLENANNVEIFWNGKYDDIESTYPVISSNKTNSAVAKKRRG